MGMDKSLTQAKMTVRNQAVEEAKEAEAKKPVAAPEKIKPVNE